MASDPELGDLELGLVKYAESALSARGYTFSKPARELLTQCVTDGVRKIRASRQPESQDIEKARAGIEKLVESISRQARHEQQQKRDQARSQGLQSYEQITISTIDAPLFSTAMSRLCPGLWPFC